MKQIVGHCESAGSNPATKTSERESSKRYNDEMLRWAYFAAGTIIGVGLLFGQAEQIPSWWFSSSSKLVAADPAFVHLSFDARRKILAQIDPKFAKLSFDKQDLFIWKAETDNLPKAPPPKEFYAREVVLKIFVGDILFQFPFSTPKQ